MDIGCGTELLRNCVDHPADRDPFQKVTLNPQ